MLMVLKVTNSITLILHCYQKLTHILQILPSVRDMSSAGGLLDVLKQKMQQSKDELEKYKEESENMARNCQEESRRREDAENEVASLNRKITLLEEDLERSEERFNLANGKLSSTS